MQWPDRFFKAKSGEDCHFCNDGRPQETKDGVRFFEGTVCDAYLRKPDIQRGLSIVVWRGRHVSEPTELSQQEMIDYFGELFRVGRAIEQVLNPVKMNYNLLGNSLPHLHTHVIPRFAEDPRPGWPFPFPEENPPEIPQDEYTALRSELIAAVADPSIPIRGPHPHSPFH